MFIEFNWTANCYIIRFGSIPTSVDSKRSWPTLADVDVSLRKRGLCVGSRTDTRTWLIANVK